jgi:Radical SAM superfamily
MDSIYWVVSRDCNQQCAHCYNDSAPGAPGLDLDAITTCIAHLPPPNDVPLHRIILSGGEVLVWPDLLFHALRLLRDRYGDATQLWVQTNGDLLDEPMLERLLDHGVYRLDVASMDRFHPRATRDRRGFLEDLFRRHDLRDASAGVGSGQKRPGRERLYAFWGATPDLWIGPLWPRGRAMARGLSYATPADDFCARWSGAKGFLDYRGEGCEVSIQLADVYPCCPMTCRPIGNLRTEPMLAMLDRCATHPVYQALNEGRPEKMGEYLGLSEAYGTERSRALGNHCLWCDEFFTQHAPDLLQPNAQTAREDADLRHAAARRG